jgi:hypothetical protein
MFDGSLKVIQGCPVSNSIDSIFRHSSTASDAAVEPDLAAFGLALVFFVALLERLAVEVVQIRDFVRAEQRPLPSPRPAS